MIIIFNNSYDPPLSFHIPKKDQCSKCNAYQIAINKEPLQEEWDNHKKREIRQCKQKQRTKKGH